MAAHEPIDPRVRLAIARWPDDAPRGAVSTFCAEHGISRKSFYELRRRATVEGPAAVLEPRSRRPRSSPSRLSDQVKDQALQVRAALEASGLDHGPISVHDKMAAMGLPQTPLSDNGVALNPSRRGYLGQLVARVSRLGVEAITGKPDKPTTQGKNERFHQTLFRYLDKQPLADTLTELQAQVDAFDHIYNTERPHQGLPGRVTPLTAWQATEKAEAPRPKPDPPFLTRPTAPRRPPAPPAPPTTVPDGTLVKRLTSQGTFRLDNVTYLVGGQHGYQHVLIDIDADTITVIDAEGEILAEHTRPAPGITYVGNGRPPGPRPKASEPSPKS